MMAPAGDVDPHIVLIPSCVSKVSDLIQSYMV